MNTPMPESPRRPITWAKNQPKGPLVIDQDRLRELIRSRQTANTSVPIARLKDQMKTEESSPGDPVKATQYQVLGTRSKVAGGSLELTRSEKDQAQDIEQVVEAVVNILNTILRSKPTDVIFLDCSARPLRYLTFYMGKKLGINLPRMHSLNVGQGMESDFPRQLRHAERLRDDLPIPPDAKILIVDDLVHRQTTINHAMDLVSKAFPNAELEGMEASGFDSPWGYDRRLIPVTPNSSNKPNRLQDKYILSKVGLREPPLPVRNWRTIERESNDLSVLRAIPHPTGRDLKKAGGTLERASIRQHMTVNRHFQHELRALAADASTCVRGMEQAPSLN